MSKDSIQSLISELDKLISVCEENAKNSDSAEKQRFYEGMAIAYTTERMRINGEVDSIELKVIDELYSALPSTTSIKGSIIEYTETCSFCRKSREEVGPLAVGPNVSICSSCLEFGAEVIKSHS
ncbi:ClpX C4-type zinc finger protein [Niallia sp. FSL W8-0635]|uniref:ClpX C4-type zinc finger protein n=1 Tax=Niallia sp. FSL W8-0635 TaxID=2975337 RepID=UPI0009C74E0F|nr:ATP-dependent Clp protease, ATP-binding subunit ClpX [Mycobacteroides abscessus subsp. abscessus]HEO8418779.1 ClpX C4-type zinc finger protein [Yersinia enterocolitica]HEO8422824.1 ClpX C4-type zinc finger protein [Yersinia enterocolitica]